LHPFCYQETTASVEFDCESARPESLSRQDILRITALAHAAGLRVILLPDPVVSRRLLASLQYESPRGHGWSEADWRDWFNAYTEITLHFARIAEDSGVDFFVVAHELWDTTHREQDWRRLIAAVRQVYHGPLTYGAIEFPGMREWQHIRFWDALDAIGINTGAGLTLNPNASQAELDAAWQAKAARYAALSEEWNRPILFVELMAHSRDGAAVTSDWRVRCDETLDHEEQAAYYRAFARALSGAPWLRGVVIWALADNPFEGGPADPHFTFLNKPAEAVVREFFRAQPHVAAFPEAPPGSSSVRRSQDLLVFDDQERSGWFAWADTADPPPDTAHPDPAIGTAAVVQPQPSSFNGVFFVAPSRVDMSPYSALEFYIYVGQPMPFDLRVQFAYWNPPQPFTIYWRVLPNDPRYITPYPLAPGTWHHVTIPLEVLGVAERPITEFSITDQAFAGCRSAPILIDEVRLIGAPTEPTP
jgi:hypothetical protein